MSTLGPREMHSAFDALAVTDNVTYVLADDGRILRTNRAWERFARANGGDALLAAGRRLPPLLAVIPAELRPFYQAGFDRACRDGVPWDHEYECSSAAVFRRFRMIAYPFGDTLVVTHALLVERPHDREPHEAADRYARDGVITLCAHCRRTRHGEVDRWDWVPAYVATMPPSASHGLCPACQAFYFPEPS